MRLSCALYQRALAGAVLATGAAQAARARMGIHARHSRFLLDRRRTAAGFARGRAPARMGLPVPVAQLRWHHRAVALFPRALACRPVRNWTLTYQQGIEPCRAARVRRQLLYRSAGDGRRHSLHRPVLGPAAGLAPAQSALRRLPLLHRVALGLAAPYLLLTFNPAW